MKKLKKLWIVPGLLLIACLALAAWDVPGRVEAFHLMQATGGGGEEPPAATTFSDDFTDGNTSGWTTILGTWSAATNVLVPTAVSGGAACILNDTDFGTSARYFWFKHAAGNGGYCAAVISSNSSGTGHVIYYYDDVGNTAFELYTISSGAGDTSLDSTSISSENVTAGKYYGFYANGSKVDIWSFGTSAPNSDPGEWGSPDATITETYTLTGFVGFWDDSANLRSFDDVGATE